MPKIVTKTVLSLFGASVLCAAVSRCVQIFSLTDAPTDLTSKDVSDTVGAVYILCVLAAAFCGIFFYKKLALKNPFEKSKSSPLFYICIITGAAMFYDFVHQCVNCYNYAVRGSYFELNYFIPMCLTGIAALFCTFYFIIMGISFKTDKYDFRKLVYFHLSLVIWFVLSLMTCFTRYNDSFYAVENNLHYAVLIFGIAFSLVMIRCIDGAEAKIRLLCFSGSAYAALSLIFSVPGIIGLVFTAELSSADFSYVSYLFTGIFAAALTLEALKREKLKEV